MGFVYLLQTESVPKIFPNLISCSLLGYTCRLGFLSVEASFLSVFQNMLTMVVGQALAVLMKFLHKSYGNHLTLIFVCIFCSFLFFFP